jgi:cyclopropane fatty-acyl-phospholipid synthase-like methyltransferase
MTDVAAFFDKHPINEGEVLSKLQADGKHLDALQPADLLAYDQDHYGGTQATDALAQRLALAPGMRVLDVCAGMGGTSRYLAWKYGCIVVGVDFTASRVAGAQALTRRVGLHGRVTIVQGDATKLALSPADFDAAVSQEAFLHIADKAALLGGCRRMLRPGGRLGFTDLLATPRLTDADRERLAEAIAALGLIAAEEYTAHLTGAGFREVTWEDLAPGWSEILRARLEMYRSLEDETVKRFGRERHERYIAGYTHFVECIEAGRLGGGRFLAVT